MKKISTDFLSYIKKYSIRCFLIIIRIFLVGIIILQISGFTLAYEDGDNMMAHTAINNLAILQFEKDIMPADPSLSCSSLDGNESSGLAWDRRSEGGPGDMIFPPDIRPDTTARKTMKGWILSGAYSADQPQGAMGLVHFYDPTAPQGEGYLTDQQFLVNLLSVIWNSHWANPHIDAVMWGFEKLIPSNTSGTIFEQNYSYPTAHENLKAALAARENYNPYYGKAWRGLGESMHIASDMTVPAHVRNDAHPSQLFDPDPYEHTTSAITITDNSAGIPADLNYRTDVISMVRSVAEFTNNNFFSEDTIDGQTSSPTIYTSPSLRDLHEDSAGYLHKTIHGSDIRIAHRKGTQLSPDIAGLRLLERPVYEIDDRVIADQRTILVPTAIRASAAVLDRFLPRFTATMNYDYADPNHPQPGNYTMHGTISLANNSWNRDEWSDMPINNGAIIVIQDTDGRTERIPVNSTIVSSMNDFTYSFQTTITGNVSLIYDLGGYVITAGTTGSPKSIIE